jgi:hypothetical protein
MNSSRIFSRRAGGAVNTVVMAAFLVGAAIRIDGRQTADEIARAIVIGQAYTSGNVYVGGFSRPGSGDGKREWPARLTVTALRTPNALPLGADFTRALDTGSEEAASFPQREDGGSAGPDDLFSTIDSMMLTDPDLALYRAAAKVARPLAVIGWDRGVAITELSFRNNGAVRPATDAERQAIAEEKKAAAATDVDCSTERQFLDSATVILNARVAKTRTAIRVSTYSNPGCAGHLSEVYVLDVLEPGQEPRRFEFRHFAGVL